jgi:hypothetical protein
VALISLLMICRTSSRLSPCIQPHFPGTVRPRFPADVP